MPPKVEAVARGWLTRVLGLALPGQAAGPHESARGRGVQERLRRPAAEVQQGAEPVLLQRHAAHLQCKQIAAGGKNSRTQLQFISERFSCIDFFFNFHPAGKKMINA